jgi:large subunit ribosomal protein L21
MSLRRGAFALDAAGSQPKRKRYVEGPARRRALISVQTGRPGPSQAKAERVHEGRKLYAIITTGGKQYKVAAGDTISVMVLPGEAGESVTFDRVLALCGDSETAFGNPAIAGASVAGEIVEQIRGPKVIAFKKRRRKNSKRKRGHRQDLTLVRITGIAENAA